MKAHFISIENSLKTWMEDRLEDIKGVLLDIDGVLTYGGHSISGAPSFLEFLQAQKIPFFLVTNDGDHSPEEKSIILQACDISIRPSQIISCGHVIKDLVDKGSHHNQLFFVLGRLGAPCYAEIAGLRTTRQLEEISSCDGIIIGEREYDWESYFNVVINRVIEMPQIPIWIPNPDIYCPRKGGGIQITAGAVGRFLTEIMSAYGIKISPVYLGKPFSHLFEIAYQQLCQINDSFLSKKQILFVGDLLAGDIKGAKDFGYFDILALTGVTSIKTLETSEILPSLTVRSLT